MIEHLAAGALAALIGHGWRAGAELDVSHVRAAYARVRLPIAVDPTPDGDYHDLRIVDQNGVEIPYAVDPGSAKTRFPIVVAQTRTADCCVADRGTQRYTVDLRAENAAIAAVRFDTATPAFAREVAIERSDDGVTWSPVTSERITRFAYGSPHLQIGTGEERARRWRVTIRSGDDLPLAAVRVSLLAQPHDLVFPVESGRRYALLFGAPTLGAPTYDLGERLVHDGWRSDPASLGPILTLSIPTATHEERRESLPGWSTSAGFGVLIVALAGFALHLLRGDRRGDARRARRGGEEGRV